MWNKGILGLLFFLLSGCGYHLGMAPNSCRQETVSIPYICGDQEGLFTAELTKAVASCGIYRYIPCGGKLTLKVSCVEEQADSIGFRYKRNREGEVENLLLASEDRLTLTVEVVLIETATSRIILGPTRLSTSVDYDYIPETNFDHLTRFSLGQLDFRESAQNIALNPLYRKLAQEIVTWMMSSASF